MLSCQGAPWLVFQLARASSRHEQQRVVDSIQAIWGQRSRCVDDAFSKPLLRYMRQGDQHHDDA
eukprot:11481078-Alexandrium_andersonii.AAC.1